jgi:PAS domain S-box-containing protein
MNILLIEDNEGHIDLVKAALERSALKYSLVVAKSFNEAKNFLDDNKYDVLIADYILPDSRGEHIKYLSGNDCPVIVMTAYGGEKEAVQSIKSGAVDYIVKSSDAFLNIPQLVQNAIRERENAVKKKEAELALNESEDKFKTIADNAPFPIIITSLDSIVLYTNQRAEEMFEIAVADKEGILKAEDFYYNPAQRNTILKSIEEKGYIKDFEIQMKTRKARIFWVALSANFVEFDKKKCIFVHVRDITDLKNSRDDLRGNEALLRSILDAAIDSIFIKDSSLRYVRVNKAMENLFGCPSSDLLWKTDLELLGPDVAKQIEEMDRKVLAGEIVEEYPERLVKGEIRYFHTIKVPLKDAKGLVVGLCAIARDITERMKTERALRKSEEVLHLITDNMIDIVSYINANGTVRYISPSFKHELGWDVEDIIGKNATDLIHKDDVRRTLRTARNAIKNSLTVFRTEYRYRHRNGSYLWFESVFRVLYENMAYAGVVFGSRNIDKRKKTEEELKRRERILLGIAEASQKLLSGMDFSEAIKETLRILGESSGADRVYIFENEEIGRTNTSHAVMKHEWVRDPLYSRMDAPAVVKISYETFFDRWKSLLEEGRTIKGKVSDFPNDERSVLAMQNIRCIFAAPIITAGCFWGFIGFDSITDDRFWSQGEEAAIQAAAGSIAAALSRIRSEEELRASEERFRNSIENAPFAINILTFDGTILYGNKQAWQLFECKPEDVVGRELAGHFWINQDHRGEWLQELKKKSVVADFETRLFNFRHTREFWAIVSGVIIDYMNKKAILAIHNDISDKKRALEERFNLERQIQRTQKLESLGVLAGGIAHDFNNLLGVILGYADLALVKVPKVDPAYSDLEGIIKASMRASDLCRQMLTYSGKGQMSIRHLDLLKLVCDTSNLLKVSVSKKVVLDLSLPEELPLIEADASQIDQVLINLVINASESFEDKIGTITLSLKTMNCSRDYLGRLILGKELSEGEYVCLRVSDTGKGMDKETLDRIFEPFFSTKFTGRGLGLSVVMGIVKSHKGAIDVKSIPGEGTAISVFFPALTEKKKRRRQRGINENKKWKGEGAILLADDEKAVLDMCREMLEYLGFEVYIAHDGREAVEIYKKNQSKIRCNIIDLTMPNMDGVEVLEEIQKITPNAIIIISSGYGEQQIQKIFAGKNLAAFIQKPYSIKILKNILHKLLK